MCYQPLTLPLTSNPSSHLLHCDVLGERTPKLNLFLSPGAAPPRPPEYTQRALPHKPLEYPVLGVVVAAVVVAVVVAVVLVTAAARDP